MNKKIQIIKLAPLWRLTSIHTKKSFAILSLILLSLQISAQFTNGNIVVLQAGDGSSALASTGNAVVIREFSPLGLPTFSLAVPSSTASGNGLVVSGSATSEGLITTSANGQYLVFAGYANTFTSTVVGASSALIPRVIGRINAAGTYSRVASSSSFYSANNIRGAASDGLSNYWGSGASQGTNYFGTVSTPTLVQNTVTNTRAINIINNQLVFSTSSGTTGIYAIGTGTPTSASSASLLIPTGAGSSPYQFCVSPTYTVVYIADDNAPGSNGGIQKWTFNGSSWSLAYTFSVSATVGARGVIANFSGAKPIIYATTGETTNNKLISIVDGGSVGSSTITTLATATSNTIFRGVTFSPKACMSPTITAINSNAPICANQTLTLQATVTGDAPLTYTWTGTGSFSSIGVLNPNVTGATSGNYTLTASNTCGTATSVVTTTVNTLPVISVNSPSMCSGSTTTLTASGTASTYTWSTNQIASSIAVNPLVTTSYSINGTTAEGCISMNSTVATVSVISTPTLSVNSETICAGNTATLTASGISTYTWSNNNQNSTITVSPTVTTVYTINGDDATCPGAYTNSVIVTVNNLPVISVNSPSTCSGSTTTLTASGTASTYTWSTNQIASSIAVNPLVTTSYSVSGTTVEGCFSMNPAVATVSVISTPTLSVNSETICAGNTATLTASGISTYTWSNNNQNPTITVNPTVTTVYTINGDDATCPGAYTNSATVTVNALPVISVNMPIICAGAIATLTASGASTYTWSSAPTQPAVSVTVSPIATTVYSVVATSSLSCVNYTTTSVVVNALPTVTANATSLLLCSGQQVTLTGGGADIYTWTNGVTNGAAFSPTATISYTVTGTSTVTSCNNKDVITVQVSTCTGIEETLSSASIIISPNPNTGYFTIQSSVFPAIVTVFDIRGRQILSRQITEMETICDLSKFDNGIYHLNVATENKTSNYKIIISK